MVEAIVAMAVGSVVILAIGSMLWFGYLGWARLTDMANVHRDHRAALDVLSRMGQAATNMTFTTGLVFTAYFSGRPAARVYADGSNLLYNPNIANTSGVQALARNTLQSFIVTISNDQVLVQLALQSSNESMSNEVRVFRRN